MAAVQTASLTAPHTWRLGRPPAGAIVMPIVIVVLGFYVVYPLALILLNSFNVARIAEPARYGLENWMAAFSQPRLLQSLANTILVYALYTSIGFPIAVFIAWALARIRMPFAAGLEFLFWVSFMLPSLFTTIGWMMLLDPDLGLLNVAIRRALPFITQGPFNIFTVSGIVWAHLMGTVISSAVMLLTPAFRNMDSSYEEASRASGASNIGTLVRITLPLMIPPLTIVVMLNIVRMFQSFEVEQLVGTPIKFYVYSTQIYQLARASEPPQYGQATALASLTLLVIVILIPLQRWLLSRRQVTTVSGRFHPGLIELGRWRWLPFGLIVFVLVLLNVVPLATVILGSFMTRAGFFQLAQVFTMKHWLNVLMDNQFRSALFNTVLLSSVTAVISPFLFSFIAYVLVRTRWRGRMLLDSIVWSSGAVPGILASLGLLWMFLSTPFLRPIYGTIWALVLVAVLQGKLTGIQLSKGIFLQFGQELEDAARASGGGWLSVYVRIWLPLITPTLILIGMMHFVIAAQSTSHIVLLATRDTITLSLLALELASGGTTQREEAGIIGLILVLLTVGLALVARRVFGINIGIRHQ
ncbi:MAG TPA: ABC transporter permease subunit [Chloroflexota bacterium]|nr:ABC transporter permease subunit [Chloroflexota bacterium]